MRPGIVELEAIIRNKICAVCDCRTVQGACGLEGGESCSLFQLFPYVAQAILATGGENLDSYLAAIREHVCSVCIDQRLDGTCPKRDDRSCALDSYLPQIVEAIEEATGKAVVPPRA